MMNVIGNGDIMKVFKRVYDNFDQNHRAPPQFKTS